MLDTTIKSRTSELPVAVVLPGKEEKEDGQEHADKRNEEAPRKANVLLHVRHTNVCNQSSGIDKPVEPVNNITKDTLKQLHRKLSFSSRYLV